MSIWQGQKSQELLADMQQQIDIAQFAYHKTYFCWLLDVVLPTLRQLADEEAQWPFSLD